MAFTLLAVVLLLFTGAHTQTPANHCGVDYAHALDCHQACPNGPSSACPPGQTCFASVPCQPTDPSNWCGTSYANAQSCTQPCPRGTNAECPASSTCFAAISVCSSSSSPSSSTSTRNTGFYLWTWNPTAGFSDATLSVAFSGWANVDNALSESLNVYGSLVGEKYISVGGGNENGRWTASNIDQLNIAIVSGRLSGFDGICYDIEEGANGLATALTNSFALAKANNLKVLVSVSHSSPYGFPDANTVMNAIISSNDVDFLSPQLYTTGVETSNDYTISNNYGWDNYRNSNAKILLSIPKANMYEDGEQFFASRSIITTGFIQWRNAA
ncbi:Glycoside hydrolase [Gracilaria domingensis]|nr:Glycoside hydrolase [Gracilaria domingensis]